MRGPHKIGKVVPGTEVFNYLLVMVAFEWPHFEKGKVDNEQMFALHRIVPTSHWSRVSFP